MEEQGLAIGKVKPATITRYQQDFDRYFYIFKRSKIRSVSETEIEKFLGGEVRKNLLNARAYSNLKTILRGILKYAKRKKLIFFEVESLLAEMDVSDRELKLTTEDGRLVGTYMVKGSAGYKVEIDFINRQWRHCGFGAGCFWTDWEPI